MQGKKILIVEDEKPMAQALQLKLSHEGFEAKMAFNGEEGIALLKEGGFDLVICDLVMPKVDGFQFLEEAKKSENKTPVIILSNLSQEEDASKARSLGAVNFFIKSNTPLAEIVEQAKKAVS